MAHTLTQPSPSTHKAKPFIPIFWSALGAQLRYCGATPNGWDGLVLQGDDPEAGKFAAYYCKGDTVVAVGTMAMDPIMAKCAELMGRGRMLGRGELEAGGKGVLQVDLVV